MFSGDQAAHTRVSAARKVGPEAISKPRGLAEASPFLRRDRMAFDHLQLVIAWLSTMVRVAAIPWVAATAIPWAAVVPCIVAT